MLTTEEIIFLRQLTKINIESLMYNGVDENIYYYKFQLTLLQKLLSIENDKTNLQKLLAVEND